MVNSYIVRIYRRTLSGAPLAGTIEDAQVGVQQRFLCASELWELITLSNEENLDETEASADSNARQTNPKSE